MSRSSSRNRRRESGGSSLYKYKAPPVALGNDRFRLLALPETTQLFAVPLNPHGKPLTGQLKTAPIPLTDLTTAINWEDKTSEITGTVSITDSTRQLKLSQGEKLRLDWSANPDQPFDELWTMKIDAPTVSAAGSTQQLSMTTGLAQANKGTESYSFRKNRSHPHGWTADQIGRNVSARTQIPIGKLAKGTHRITKLVQHKAKPLDIIIKAYRAERVATGRLFFVYWDGRLNILPLTHSQDLLLFAGVMIDAQYQEKLPSDFATVLTVRGTAKARKRGSHKRMKRTQHKLFVTVSSPAGIRKYGYIHREVNAPSAQTVAEAKRWGANLLRKVIQPERTLTVTIPFRPTLRRGNAFKIDWKSQGLTQVCYVSGLSHNVTPGGSQTTITCTFTDPFTDVIAKEAAARRAAKAKQRGRHGGASPHAAQPGSSSRARRRA